MRFCPTCLSIYVEEIDHCGIDGTRIVETSGDPLIGRTIDRYRVDARIGVGAHGIVYRATHEFLGSAYAMKVLLGRFGANQRVVERFRREAEAVSAIDHPNVVTVTDFGTTPRGLTFLVMEFLEGETLDRLMGRVGPLPAQQAVRIARQIAAGLDAAHRRGYVHRDIKPANVMVCTKAPQALAKLLDFGIVGTTKSTETTRSATGSGRLVGTPLYMAPEQARQPDLVGPASDFYSLGIMLFQMLSGRPPFDAPTVVDLVIQHAMEPVPELDVPPELWRVLRSMLAKAPAERPTGEQLLAALDAIEIDSQVPISAPTSATGFEPPDTLDLDLDPFDERTPLQDL